MLVIMVAQNSPKLTIVRPRGSTLVAQTDAQADLPVDLPLAPKKHPSDTAAVAQQAMGKPSGRSEDRRFGFTKELLNRLPRSEEHTSELQSLRHLVCRLLLEK